MNFPEWEDFSEVVRHISVNMNPGNLLKSEGLGNETVFGNPAGGGDAFERPARDLSGRHPVRHGDRRMASPARRRQLQRRYHHQLLHRNGDRNPGQERKLVPGQDAGRPYGVYVQRLSYAAQRLRIGGYQRLRHQPQRIRRSPSHGPRHGLPRDSHLSRGHAGDHTGKRPVLEPHPDLWHRWVYDDPIPHHQYGQRFG